MAKQRQDFVSARLMQLKNRLADLSLINMNNIPKDRIAFGSKVTLYDVDRDVEIEYRLVTSEEADVSKGLISTTSPIGRGLMGKKPGDTIKVTTPNGSREFEIRAVLTFHEQAVRHPCGLAPARSAETFHGNAKNRRHAAACP